MRSWLAKALGRCQVIAAAAATDALSTCIGSNSLCCGSTMSRHLGDTSCSIHTHNLHSSWDEVRTSSGVFLYSMNESTLLTKAVSALCLSQVYDGGGGDVLLASYNDAAAPAAVSSGRKIPTKTTCQAAWLGEKHE